ncbi:putative GntR family transcriptional regulator [Oscillibacter valericigenes Sjm18-20]|nr:putative GntR family transcriptional regulator [Oscillibacter valericigenes Sjm18-20]
MTINSFENYLMSWKPTISDRKAPIYTQLAGQLAQDIRAGILRPGDKLPPQRELADFLDLHLSTITRIYKLCEEQGLICAKVGQGTFVSSDVNTSDTLLYSHETMDYIQLGTILPPYNGNEKVVNFIKGVLTQPDIQSFLEYRSPSGTYVQRKTISDWIERIGVHASPENVLLATGGQNAICAITLGLFRPGDRIGTNPLSFSGLKSIAKMIGVQLVPLPEEDGHIQYDNLEQFCRSENLKGFYFVPEQHNPTTHTMKLEERICIGEVAKKLNIIIIEDAINRVFSEAIYPPLFSYAPNNTLCIFSISKFLCPGLRVAYLIAPDRYRGSVENSLYTMNLMVSPWNAEIVNRIFNSPLLDTLIHEKKEELIARNRIADLYFSSQILYGTATCSFRWLILPDRWESQKFETKAKEAGVQVFCSDRFAIGKAPPPKAVRLCVSAPKSKAELEKALVKLKRLLTRADRSISP